MYKFIIPIPARTKKNSQRIIYCGGRPRIIQSKEYLEYEEQCYPYLKPLQIDYPVNVKSVFYMPTRRRVDLSNLISACHDILVKYKVITDDNITKSLQVLIDNGIDEDEAETVLQAIGYTLIDTELFEDNPID